MGLHGMRYLGDCYEQVISPVPDETKRGFPFGQPEICTTDPFETFLETLQFCATCHSAIHNLPIQNAQIMIF